MLGITPGCYCTDCIEGPPRTNPGAVIGAANRQRVLDWLMRHPGATNNECAKATGLSIMAVSRHVKAIRQLWPIDPRPAAPGTSKGAPKMAEPSTLPEFNPSGSDVVATIKAKTEDLLAYLRDNVPGNRERSIAVTNYEQAAMWAVKANFTTT